ncbi:glycoside hydrolase family 43 protein [Aureobasidium pullulans]|nr:glycoside hydrolase family 43 protein [Aureobasidium pullulans]
MVSALLASFFFGFNAFVAASCLASNTTYTNPILPGFHPDPSCIFVKEWDNTFFCASSSFEAFPGIPIHASKDLQNWKLIGNVLNRPEQLPDLAFTNRSTSGIWAPAIRYHDDAFWLVTTLVFDNKTQIDSSRWDKRSIPYVISAPGHLNTLQLSPSLLNLTGHDGIYTGGEPQTLLARRQTDTLFTFSVDLEFTPTTMNEEAGVTVFLTQDHHMELGLVLLSNNGTSTPTLRFRAKSNVPVPQDVLFPVPANWTSDLHMEIKVFNLTHYAFSAGPAGKMSLMQTIAYASASLVSYGFTGTLVGVYNTLNGGGQGNGTKAYISNWNYQGQGQFLD